MIFLKTKRRELLYKIKGKLKRYVDLLFGQKPKGIFPINFGSYKSLEVFKNITVERFKEEYFINDIFVKHLPNESWEAFVPFDASGQYLFIDIKNSSFKFSNNLLITPHNTAVFESHYRFDQLLLSKNHLSSNYKVINGTVAYLSNTWVDNYYHWLFFTLPLLKVYQHFTEAKEIRFYYLGETRLTGFQVETLRMFGISTDQIVTSPCRATRLLMAFSFNRKSGNGIFYRSFYDYLFTRQMISSHIKNNSGSHKRIYVKRGNVKKRKVENESEVVDYLNTLGFAAITMDGKAVLEQAAIFQNAEAIVALHGAALANCMFCAPGSILVEMFPENYCEISHFSTACFSRMKYYYLKCSTSLNNEFVRVDMNKLSKICEMAEL